MLAIYIYNWMSVDSSPNVTWGIYFKYLIAKIMLVYLLVNGLFVDMDIKFWSPAFIFFLSIQNFMMDDKSTLRNLIVFWVQLNQGHHKVKFDFRL